MKISVIVPVYNSEKYLQRCINSILNQTYKDLELILIDDGSTDSSGSICDSFAKIDSRVRVIHQKNSGVSEARNIGLNHAVGDYITFVDSDDYIDSRMYEELINLFLKYNADITHCGYKRVNPEGVIQKEVHGTHKVLCQNQIEATNCFLRGEYFNCGIWNKLFKASLFERVRFDSHLKVNEDVVVGFLAFQNAKKIVFIDETFYCYVVHDESACNTIDEKRKILDEIEATKLMINECVHESNLKVLEERLFDKMLRLYRWHIFHKETSDKFEKKRLKREIRKMKGNLSHLDRRLIMNYYLLIYFYPIYKMIYTKYNQLRKPDWDPKI